MDISTMPDGQSLSYSSLSTEALTAFLKTMVHAMCALSETCSPKTDATADKAEYAFTQILVALKLRAHRGDEQAKQAVIEFEQWWASTKVTH